jgi:hypothetical protein
VVVRNYEYCRAVRAARLRDLSHIAVDPNAAAVVPVPAAAELEVAAAATEAVIGPV